MTDQEINEAVARKLGWASIQVENGTQWTNPKGETLVFGYFLPDYCHSIEAAWEAVEFMKARFFFINVSWVASKFWGCSVWGIRDTDTPAAEAQADTAPMAICLAFLKLPDEPPKEAA